VPTETGSTRWYRTSGIGLWGGILVDMKCLVSKNILPKARTWFRQTWKHLFLKILSQMQSRRSWWGTESQLGNQRSRLTNPRMKWTTRGRNTWTSAPTTNAASEQFKTTLQCQTTTLGRRIGKISCRRSWERLLRISPPSLFCKYLKNKSQKLKLSISRLSTTQFTTLPATNKWLLSSSSSMTPTI